MEGPRPSTLPWGEGVTSVLAGGVRKTLSLLQKLFNFISLLPSPSAPLRP